MFIPNRSMPETFISLKEAEKYTGKSRSTLRRFVVTITKPDAHPDRELIKPSVEKVGELHAANHPFSWTVSTTLLDREFKKEGSAPTDNSADANNLNATTELLNQTIAMLKTELEQKNKQISNFQERQRENNVLLKSAHEQLTQLASGASSRQANSAEAATVQTQVKEEGSRSAQTTDGAPVKAEKKTLWQRLNRPLFQR